MLLAFLGAQPPEPLLETNPDSVVCETIVEMHQDYYKLDEDKGVSMRTSGLEADMQELRYNCQMVVNEALHVNLDPYLAVSLATFETHLRPWLVSSRNCRGMLQVQPRYHCPNGRTRGCNFLREGIEVAKEYTGDYGTLIGISAFRAGPRNRNSPRSIRKARNRMAFADYLRSHTIGVCEQDELFEEPVYSVSPSTFFD